jgi:triosephosphate isomerase
MSRRPKLIAGNWKMHGSRADASGFIDRLGALAPGARPVRQLLICPPATLIALMADALRALDVLTGGEDCHYQTSGAFTGDISAAMLKDLGCAYVIVGHSERRAMHGETDRIVRSKAEAALKAGLIPIICVGETSAEREAGRAEAVVRAQIAGSVPDGIAPAKLVVAYEPIWAIGSGRTATLNDIAAMHLTVRRECAAKSGDAEGGQVLYGGSVKPDNAQAILALDLVDGALIGGASLKADDFMAIADAVKA